jgi:hypothetical protein
MAVVSQPLLFKRGEELHHDGQRRILTYLPFFGKKSIHGCGVLIGKQQVVTVGLE